MSTNDGVTDGELDEDSDVDDERRRRLLVYAALATVGMGGAAGAWALSRDDDGGDTDPSPSATATTSEGTERADGDTTEEVPELVARYAPDLYFGTLEKWFPTDPRPYVVETHEGRVVDGFAALEGYAAAYAEAGEPPAPVAFYNVVEAADGVDALQYWFYSTFDQFTVNFHWHDWELLQVFVDRETGAPLLLSASAHARSVPNNEFRDPALGGDRRPGILTEVGSHSSASEVNELLPSFERLPTGDRDADVTNELLGFSLNLGSPFAYGLPRDEGARLPFVMPELDGHRLDDHPSLSVGTDDFVDESVTVSGWRDLARPPADLPLREPGLTFAHVDSSTEADVRYTLEPLSNVADAVDGFVGPQLSFEFVIPGFVEDRFASFLTSVGIPWQQPRFSDPLDDVTDPAHRRYIDGSEPSGLLDRVVGRARQLGSGATGALDGVADSAQDALADVATVSLFGLPVEAAVRLASEDPVATVTRDGAFGYLHVAPGEHLLALNGPGYAPLAQRFVHEGGTFRAGSDGELTLVANEDAGWIRGDGRTANGITHVRVVEDYAGVVYDGDPAEDDRFAVAVHRDGHYTVEVVDGDGRLGAYRVTPDSFDENGDVVREVVETGKLSLATTLRDELVALLELARSLADAASGGGEVRERLAQALEAAEGATAAAQRGDGRTTDRQLSTTVSFLTEALELLSGDDGAGYDEGAVAVLLSRAEAAVDRAGEAIDAELV
ncbi:hypothetical protein [Haloarchaeobius litoreus]|uniref:Uncharacterized protein n=1 Tax=Haloarchaeobius litoreus TaxID=755306 RepID=A0ABD6DME2_9EURY|nr:hypothetical protein [Haloarchaeobius litoreus]